MKVMLVFPRFKYRSGDLPLGLAYIASHLRAHTRAEVSILDATFHPSMSYVSSRIEKEKPDIVGIYFDTIMYNDGLKIAEIAKKFCSFVVAGGPHATILPDTLIDHVDVVVIGEGEETVKEIVEKYPERDFSQIKGIWYKKNNEIIRTPPRPPLENLDALEFPARDLFEFEKYIKHWHTLDSINTNIRGANILASRGCPYNCSFCQPTLRRIFGEKVRTRSIGNIIDEIKYLKEKYAIDALFFHDDTLTADSKWITQFCEKLRRDDLEILWSCNARINTLNKELMKTMYDLGLRQLHIGVESGSQRVLDEVYQKGIKIGDIHRVIDDAREIGIRILCFFMIGAPTETEKEIKQTIRFACSLNATEITATICSPLPGTHLYNRMKDKYEISGNFSDFDYYSKRAFVDGNLPYWKLKRYQMELLFRFYSHPKRWHYIMNHLTSVNGWRKMILKVKRFL